MVAEPPRSLRRLFPEIRVHLGLAERGARVALPPPAQIAGLVAILAGTAAVVWLARDWGASGRLAAREQIALVQAVHANADLQDQVEVLHNRLALARDQRQTARQQVAKLVDQTRALDSALSAAEEKLAGLRAARQQQKAASHEAASAKAGSIAEATVALDRAEQELHRIEAERATLAARLNQTEANRRTEQARSAEYEGRIAAAKKALRRLGAERRPKPHKNH